MESLTQISRRLSALWQSWTGAQRASVIGGGVLCVALVVGVGLWATQPQYVALASDLSPADAAEIVSVLETEGIAYQLNFSGSAVLVSRAELNRARLAVRDTAAISAVDDTADDVGSGLWADPAVTGTRLLRDQESRLARSLMQLRAVRAATVHLTRPETSPFVRDRLPATASVVLELQPGVPFSAADAQGVVSLVAHGVEGLSPENVSVIDTQGRQLAARGGPQADIVGRLEYQQRLESELSAKAEAMLSQLLGPGRASVRVTADIDFTEIVRKETTFDPAGKVKVSENITSESTTQSGGELAGGVAGAGSNLGSGARATTRGTTLSQTESNETTYDNSRIEDTVTEVPGRIRRLTIAAVVQPPLSEPGSAGGAETAAPDKKAIEAIIRQAVGFDEQRQDGIEVLLAAAPAAMTAPATLLESDWSQYERLLRSGSLGLAALVALLLGFLAIRRLRPVTLPGGPVRESSIELAQRLAALSRRAEQNPEAASRVLTAWLNEAEQAPAQRKAA